jgi:hypothetical protein
MIAFWILSETIADTLPVVVPLAVGGRGTFVASDVEISGYAESDVFRRSTTRHTENWCSLWITGGFRPVRYPRLCNGRLGRVKPSDGVNSVKNVIILRIAFDSAHQRTPCRVIVKAQVGGPREARDWGKSSGQCRRNHVDNFVRVARVEIAYRLRTVVGDLRRRGNTLLGVPIDSDGCLIVVRRGMQVEDIRLSDHQCG